MGILAPNHDPAIDVTDILDVDAMLAGDERGDGGRNEVDASAISTPLNCVRRLKAHPNFDCVARGGHWVRGLCRCIVHLESPWHVNTFVAHDASCTGLKKRKAKVKAAAAAASKDPSQTADEVLPCPGLRGPDVVEYITSAVQLTGGSRPKFKVARALFPTLFSTSKCNLHSMLCPFENKWLHDTLAQEALWWVDKDAATVRSFRCTRAARMQHPARLPCSSCASLRGMASFRTALASRATLSSSSRNQKFTPRTSVPPSVFNLNLSATCPSHAKYGRELRQLVACYKHDVANPHYYWLPVAEMGMALDLNDSPVVLGLLQYLVALKDKERRGVGKQNMPYAPSLDAFVARLADISVHASDLFQQHFCGRSKRLAKKAAPIMALLAAASTDNDPPPDHPLNIIQHPDTIVESSVVQSNLTQIACNEREMAWKEHASQHPNEKIPCPGLSAPSYVEYSLQLTGGSRPRHVLARELFPTTFGEGKGVKNIAGLLSVADQQLLLDAVHREAVWRIDKTSRCVRSMQCLGTCVRRVDACANCMLLHRNASFRSAVSRARKQSRTQANIRFIPNQYMTAEMLKVSKNPTLRMFALNAKANVESNPDASFWLQVARLGISGAFRDFPVVEGVVESLLHVKDKQRRGAGNQNMFYPVALETFMKHLVAISPKALELFADAVVGGHSVRAHILAKKRKLAAAEQSPPPLVFHDIPMPAMLMYDTHHPHDRLLDDGFHDAAAFGQELLTGDPDLGTSEVMQL
ncbi:hypothetical protein B5M09_002318 [Aphanomyces astaci]|nr:hypothetical protein B5M09_002318 [Aphanomyces astaci]